MWAGGHAKEEEKQETRIAKGSPAMRTSSGWPARGKNVSDTRIRMREMSSARVGTDHLRHTIRFGRWSKNTEAEERDQTKSKGKRNKLHRRWIQRGQSCTCPKEGLPARDADVLRTSDGSMVEIYQTLAG